MLIECAVCFLAALLLSYLLATPVRKLAVWLDVVDKPEKRKMHQIPIPLMGGIGIFIAFLVTAVGALLVSDNLRSITPKALFGLLLGGGVVLVLGIVDDIWHLSPRQKLVGQALAALIVVLTGGGVETLTNPLGESFHIGWLGVPLSILWIVGVINAVNLIDGLDGLAAGTGCIAALGLAAVAASGNPSLALLSVILAGSLAGFLPHNFYPARIFLGDSGSMFIGFTVATIGLQGSYKASAATALFLPIIVLGVPLFDTLFAIFRRARKRVNPFKADREHIHHRLVRVGLHHRNVVLVLYFACAYLALTAYAIAQFPYQTALLFLVLLTMGGVIGLRTLRFIEELLESHAGSSVGEVPAGRGTARRTRTGREARASHDGYATLVCEVSGLREDLGEPDEVQSMCRDIQTMLSRRVRVQNVAFLPTAPSRAILLIRTEPLKSSLKEMVRDGIRWYLEEHRERLANGKEFPGMQWIDLASAGSDLPDAAPAVAGGKPAAQPEKVPLPLRKGQAPLAG